MKICAFSDIHGQLNFNIEPCDITLICGDIVPLNIQTNMILSEQWFKETFIPWCNNLPCDKVIFIAGNHDFILMNHPDRIRMILQEELATKRNEKIIYLECNTYEYKGKIIYGTPWCKIFGNWAFMKTLGEQDEMYDKALDKYPKMDIIMSHDAPYGTSDILLQKDCWWANGEHIGNKALKKFTEKANPQILLHGHLHSTNREVEYLGYTEVYNVSLLNENYKMVYTPQYFTLKENNDEK